MADQLTVQPVARFARCIFGGCKGPVQFLHLNSGPPIPLCGSHGLDEASSEGGSRVVYAEPLGFISATDPEPAA